MPRLFSGFSLGAAIVLLLPSWLPHDALGWATLVIAILSAWIAWKKGQG